MLVHPDCKTVAMDLTSVALDLASKIRIHGGLRGRAHGYWLLQIRLASFGHPCNLSSEAFNMLLFSLKVVRADEDGKIGISNFERLDFRVKPRLDSLPDCVGRRL